MEAAGSMPERIAGYPVLRLLGRGGMGSVYLGHDPRLDRPLAIKVLPETFSRDRGLLSRLRREARILASLSHPNIATIYGLEELDDGNVALILEFIDGNSLQSELRQGPLPAEEALELCRQIASALEATHERGLTHRDLKPANVMLTRTRWAKLLDFGLAEPGAASASEAPETDSTRRLGKGSGPHGTLGYASPEQLRGLPADRRADLFSFGCLLYECLSGKRAFRGATAVDLIAATLSGEPDPELLPPATSGEARRLIERCLRKDPRDRPGDIGEVRRELTRILAGSATATSAANAGGPPVTARLSRPLTSFLGRERELDELRRLLAGSRLVTLTGPGGCGKTRLATELAAGGAAESRDGVFLADLSRWNDPLQVPPAVAAALNVKDEPGRSTTLTLVERLREARTLLILDNCEHLLSGCAVLAEELLRECSGLRIVATSRERLGLAGEQEYPVPSLTLPDARPGGTADLVMRSGAVRLFVDRARLVRPGWRPSDEDAAPLAEICRRLDGNPLALELAAARMRVLSVNQIHEKLQDRFRLLTRDGAAPAHRHQTLRGALDWSHDLLSQEERDLLHGLSVFAGGWSLEAATAACREGLDEFEVLDLLAHLVDKSLVVVDRDPGGGMRYRLLETVRQYAQEKLGEGAAAEALRDRHLDFFLALGEEATARMRGPDQAVWFRRLAAEHENLLAALDHAQRRPESVPKGLRLIADIWPFWENRGHISLGRERSRRLLQADRDPAPGPLRTGALTGAGNLAWHQSDFVEARALHEEALSIHRRLDNRRGIAISLASLGLVAMETADLPAARSLFEEALAAFRDLGDDMAAGKTLGNLAIVLRLQGDLQGAKRFQEENLAIQRRLGNKRSAGIALYNLVVLSLQREDYPEARTRLLEGLRLFHEIGDRLQLAIALERAAELEALERAGGVSGPHRGPARGVRLLGAAAALRQSIDVPLPEKSRALQEAGIAALREAMGEADFDRAWNEGRSFSDAEAVRYAADGLAD
jgi:non-specific serine/threonine protein kinase